MDEKGDSMHIRSVTKGKPAMADNDLLGSLDVLSYLLTNIQQMLNILTSLYNLFRTIGKDISTLV